jgi:hypothetical protein
MCTGACAAARWIKVAVEHFSCHVLRLPTGLKSKVGAILREIGTSSILVFSEQPKRALLESPLVCERALFKCFPHRAHDLDPVPVVLMDRVLKRFKLPPGQAEIFIECPRGWGEMMIQAHHIASALP